MTLSEGQTLGRYEIAGHLGAGGMGIVYRALDSQLGREVAIKVLNEEAASSPARIERFVQEARSVARLSHPNILDIHDFGDHNGTTYLVTELLHGQTLRDRLLNRQIPVAKGLKICRDIAEGLSAAHGQGIIHRDIKPSNVFITTTGQVKILDFGIARLRDDPDEDPEKGSIAPTESVAGSSRMVGTAGYMSPEQIEGRCLDGRSDIFSLGCVMYEVLTGRRAFSEKNTTDTILAILGKDPELIRDVRPEVPQPVEAIVQRCLEKQPGERFESARDVAFSLGATVDRGSSIRRTKPLLSKRTRSMALKTAVIISFMGLAGFLGSRLTDILPPASPQIPLTKHIAIVPFQTDGQNTEFDQFAAGLIEILAEDLEWLAEQDVYDSWVVPPAASRAHSDGTFESIFRRFNPNVILTGSLDRRGPMLQFEFTSVEPETGGTYEFVAGEADLGNVSSLQVEPVARAADLVGLYVSDENREILLSRTTNVAQAFDLYVRGRGVIATLPPDGPVEPAIILLEESTSLDPLFVPAQEALAQALAMQFAATGDTQFLDRGMEILDKLVERSPSQKSLRIMADFHSKNGAEEEAVTALENAVALAPTNGEANLELGAALQRTGRAADAEQAIQRSINLRPGYWIGPNALGRLYLGDGRYDAAANSFRQIIECSPLNRIGYNLLGVIKFLQDDLESSRVTFESSVRVEPKNNYFAFANLGTLHFNAARFADAITVYEQALGISDTDYQVWGNLAFAYAFGAEPEKSRDPFFRAIDLAEDRRADDPDNIELLADLAGYYAMVDDVETCRNLLEKVVDLEPTDPQVFARIGETYEDIGDRDAALQWIGRALDGGIQPRFFESRPMLRDLISDPRYRALIIDRSASPE